MASPSVSRCQRTACCFRICLQYNLNGCVRILLTSAFSISSRNLSPLVGLGTAGSIHMKPQPDLEPTMPRVLVAEDDTLVRIAIAEALRDAGFRVMEAASAAEALAYLEAAERVDLVFSDIQMPGSLDRFGLARRLRGPHPQLPLHLTPRHPPPADGRDRPPHDRR